MHRSFREYALSFALSVLVVIASAIVAWRVARRCARDGDPALVPTARVLAVGGLFLILATTAVPYIWPPPELQGFVGIKLSLGSAGLDDWLKLFTDPISKAALLFVGNVLLYVPVSLFGTVGWANRRAAVLLGCVLVSCLVELVQYQWLHRTAAVDDVVLNTAGAVLGSVTGWLTIRWDERRRRPWPTASTGSPR